MKFAEVAVDSPTGSSQPFSYSIPDGMTLAPGQLVRVPFGPRSLHGIVFELADAPQVEETRPVSATLFDEPLLDSNHLALARWISDYYVCAPFEAAAPMLPPGSRIQSRAVVSVAENVDDIGEAANSERQLRVLEAIQRGTGLGEGPVDVERLVSNMGEWVRGAIGPLVNRGVVERSYRASRRMIGPHYSETLSVREGARDEIARWLGDESNRAWRQTAFVRWMLESDRPVSATDARREFGGQVVAAVVGRGFVEAGRKRVFRDPLADRVFEPEPSVTLSSHQAAAASDIIEALRGKPDASGVPGVALLQGVTGSGKTEVYLSAVEECLRLGKQAIVMAPEIALTPQTIERFASRFPGQVAVQHSGLTDGQRHDQWWAIHNGERSVVIGSRSAVFAPAPNLGLIVMDEEHEWTYKQHDAAPRYHARSVAVRLGEISGSITLLGSASPDVGSYFRGLRGQYGLRRLPHRLSRTDDGSTSTLPMPEVEVVDMRRELRDGNRSMFSRRLRSEIEACLSSGQQSILFLNRRGTATLMQCRNCGAGVECQGCNVPLTYHRPAQRLICHYCGRRRRMPENCPQCSSYRLSSYGIGTESVATELGREFPNARILRWDRDAVRYAREYEALLSAFRGGEADVIVGTQMVAKGLHLPGVMLVGVVLADVGLSIPDYRSGERTFQLLCQVAGRAGREREGGSVIFQTYQPDNYAIRAAAAQDFEGFYESEMRYRREQGNPPYSRIIRLLTGHTNVATAESRALELAEALRTARAEADLSDVEVLGPTPPYPPRLRGRYRWHIVLRGRDPRALLDMVEVRREWAVDVDPVALT